MWRSPASFDEVERRRWRRVTTHSDQHHRQTVSIYVYGGVPRHITRCQRLETPETLTPCGLLTSAYPSGYLWGEGEVDGQGY